MRRLIVPLLLIMTTAGCGQLRETPTEPGGGGSPPPNANATFTRVQTEIFSPTCAQIGCHDSMYAQESLDLSAGKAYANIVNQRSIESSSLNRVTPGNPDGSYLYQKVAGSAGITGDRMPQGGLLTSAQVLLIHDWIARGAPND